MKEVLNYMSSKNEPSKLFHLLHKFYSHPAYQTPAYYDSVKRLKQDIKEVIGVVSVADAQDDDILLGLLADISLVFLNLSWCEVNNQEVTK